MRQPLEADVAELELEQLIRATLTCEHRIRTKKLAVVHSLLQLLSLDLMDERYPLLPSLETIQRVLDDILVECLALNRDVEENE